MTRLRRRPLLLLALAIALLAPGTSEADDSPEGVLLRWQSALAGDDHAAYLACLHSGTRQVPAYASLEAMTFWAGQLEQLRARGFDGQFVIEAADDTDPRVPAGALRALPVLNGQPIRDEILLLREDGHWTLLRWFS